jgi:hypothetical protein
MVQVMMYNRIVNVFTENRIPYFANPMAFCKITSISQAVQGGGNASAPRDEVRT